MNFSTTKDDFSILKNGIDTNLEIIRHDETGYYNITKIANLINKLKAEKDGSAGIPADSPNHAKRPNHWLSNASTKELIKECKIYADLDEVVYELNTGTRNEFRGTYVHRYLYDQFLNWLDVKYAIRISRLLDDIHQEANKKIIKEKDDKIDELSRDVKNLTTLTQQQSKQMQQQSDQIAELLGYAKETTETLHEVRDDLTETKEEVQIAKSYLQEKSFTSTKNPTDESKHHYFAATTYFDKSKNQIVKFVSGQKSYVDKTIDKNVNTLNHKIIIKPFFNANGIDLRQNVHEEFGKRRAERIKEINAENAIKDREFNKQLSKEIKLYNKANPDKKRIYVEEKQKTPAVKAKDILVKFSKLSFTYAINPYIGFKEVLQIIIDVNNITQESPLTSDDEE